jgi:Protein of unknown function (DUF3040)
MLSEREQRELALIEQRLHDDDRRFAASFRGRRGVPRPRRQWPVWALIGVGLLLVLAGLVTGISSVWVEGLLVAGTGVAWSRWQAYRWRVRRGAAEAPEADPEEPTR